MSAEVNLAVEAPAATGELESRVPADYKPTRLEDVAAEQYKIRRRRPGISASFVRFMDKLSDIQRALQVEDEDRPPRRHNRWDYQDSRRLEKQFELLKGYANSEVRGARKVTMPGRLNCSNVRIPLVCDMPRG